MTLAEIFEKVEAGNQNPTFTREDFILPLVNEAIQMVAERFCINELAGEKTITISPSTANYIALPDDYNHDLYLLKNITDNNREINLRPNLLVLERLFPGEPRPGYVTDAAATESMLYFAPALYEAEGDQDLKLYYYTSVDEYEIGDVDETPEWIPKDLHKGLIVDFVLKELWALEEDGIDGQKINTAFYENQHNKALQKMARHTRFNPRCRPVVQRTARFH